MIFNQPIQEVQQYFGLKMNDRDKDKLKKIFYGVFKEGKAEGTIKTIVHEKVIVKEQVVLLKKLKRNKANTIILEEEIQPFLTRYGVTLEEAKSGNRIGDHVSKCRIHFARFVLKKWPLFRANKLAKFFNLDHTTVHHMLYKSNIEVPILPLKKERVYVRRRGGIIEKLNEVR